jgi:hypothetical protein
VTIAAQRPPDDAQTLLADTGSRGRSIFKLVRALLDDFDEAAPWSVLYAPPTAAGELRDRLERLNQLVEQAPRRVAAELELLELVASNDDEREALQEAEFYFTALHHMTAQDSIRLAGALAQLPAVEQVPRARADFLCELAADLKGKYSSAIMGAAAALVSEGRWLGVEVEALLFPEKAEERERNDRLLAALESAAASLVAAIEEFPWRTVLASWRRQEHVEHYALADLVALRSHLLTLLTVGNRRALYSGDFHQLQGREIRLGSRLRELEALHLHSLDLVPSTNKAEAELTFGRLHQLLLEVAALLDVERLRELIGDDVLRDLRGRGKPAVLREDSAGRLDSLALLIDEEDLKIFLKLLVGAVRKRSSIAYRLGEVRTPPPTKREAEAAVRKAALVRFDPAAGKKFAAKLTATLTSLTQSQNQSYQAFQMVQKLQSRLRVLPPALLAEIAPFLAALHNELLPLLEQTCAAGAMPASAVETLRTCYRRLNDSDFTRPETALGIGSDLARVMRLLDSLKAAAAALGR